MSTSHEHLLPAVCDIARRAAAAIIEVYSGEFAVREKDDHSPLTAADMAAHKLIVAALDELTPGWPILSEEAADIPWSERRQWQRYWLVDPLDGTREFVKRNGEFTVNIALIESGEPVLGVVQVPVTGAVYAACRGHGAQCIAAPDADSKPLATGEVRHPVRVAGSRSHARPEQQAMLARLGDYQTTPMGSSLKFCLVARDDADLYLRLGPTSEWDTAAAHCVLAEAGGQVLDLDGQPLRYNQKDSLLNPSFMAVGEPDADWARRLQDGSDSGP